MRSRREFRSDKTADIRRRMLALDSGTVATVERALADPVPNAAPQTA
jgi:hypothetical protein